MTRAGAITTFILSITIIVLALMSRQTAEAAAEHDRCGGAADIQCDDGLWCEPDHAACNVADPSGTCVTVPAGCPDMALPVCGCDHRSYGNDCQRRAAKMAKESNDACDATTCPDVIDKVCATKDGKLVTYDNYCVALRDAARRMSKGACKDGK